MDVAFSPLYSDSSAGATRPCSSPQAVECRGRRSYTLQFKLEVVKWLEKNGSSLRQASKHFGITRRVIRTWLEQKEQLREAMDLNIPTKRKLHSGRAPASHELDKGVLDYLVRQRERQVCVSDSQLRGKALDVGYQLGLSGFKANFSWLKRWKQRHGVKFHNGTNDIVTKQEKLSKSTFLSQVDSSEQIKLVIQHSTSESFDITQTSEGPVYLDFTTAEHNYCQRNHQPNVFISSSLTGHIDASEEDQLYHSHHLHCHQLGSEQDIATLNHSSELEGRGLLDELTAHEQSSLTASRSAVVDSSALDLMIPTSGVVQELVEGLALPLGHEEVVGESGGGRDGELIITQAAAVSISPPTFSGGRGEHSLLNHHSLSSQEQSLFTSASSPPQQTLLSACSPRDITASSTRLQEFVSLQSAQDYLVEMNRFLQEAGTGGSGGGETSGSSGIAEPKSKGGKKRYQPKRGCSRTKPANTKTKKSIGQGGGRRGRAVTPVATFPHLLLDDPQGYSGLLASRLSQPVFPGEPEFVYTDMATSH